MIYSIINENMVTIRRATAKDAGAIRALIRQVRINPTGLNWQHFLVAVDEREQVVATGQVKPLRDGTLELASIATLKEYRHQGLASTIVGRLLAETPRPMYLVCAEPLGSFYQRFGFRELLTDEMPPVLGREALVFNWVRQTVVHGMPRLLVMKLD